MQARLLIVVLCMAPLAAAQKPDPDLLAKIHTIRAIDNHAHTPRLVTPGETDDEYDALPCDPLQPAPPTLTQGPENPQYIAALKALFGYKYEDMSPDHLRELLETKKRIKNEQGDHYPIWVLDHLGIETELSNRVAMGRGLEPPRFRWVPFDDALLLPLNNEALGSETPDRNIFYKRETQLLKRYRKDLGLDRAADTLDEYLSQVVTPMLESQKKRGAVAVKFEAAYLRSLDFDFVDRTAAQRIYAHYLDGSVPNRAEYYKLQDFLFRYIAAEAGRLGLPVHIHTGIGCGSYFVLLGANPLLLESVLNDAALRGTKFVLLHGGAGPYTKEIAALLMKPNVYTDFSEQTWLIPTRELSKVLRYWLEWYPEKIIFGTDLSPGSPPEWDWEEAGWQATESGREALAIALTGMMDDGEITRERAEALARMALRENALNLYGWGDH